MHRRDFLKISLAGATVLPSMSIAALGQTPPKGVLRYGLVSEVTSLDPHVYSGSAGRAIVEGLYSQLVAYDTTGNIVPRLAESWTESPDAKSITFTLRSDVTFHDGTPLTVEDVKYSYERIQGEGTGATLRPNFLGARIVVVSPREIRIEKDSPDAALLGVLALPEAAILSRTWMEAGGDIKLSANGTGPFRLAAFEPAVSARIDADPDYFVPDEPLLAGVEYRMIKSDDARVNALRGGTLDMIQFVPPKDIDILKRVPGITVDSASGAFMNIWFNPKAAPFDDKRVRQAVAYAIDRQMISQAAFFGHGSPIEGAPTPSTSPFYNAEFEGRYKRDLDAARRLLSEAGHADGLKMELIVFQGLGYYVTMAQIIQANLAEVGIDVSIQLVEWANVIERKNSGNYQAMLYGVSIKTADPDAYSFYVGADSTYWAKPIAYVDEEVEKLLLAGRSTVDFEERRRIYRDLEAHLLDSSAWVFINWREQAQGYRDAVKGYVQLEGALNESSSGISLPHIVVE
jgi:peptide/nickel transport system substrate-binding protein/glutathione transport system substrate-binding protein